MKKFWSALCVIFGVVFVVFFGLIAIGSTLSNDGNSTLAVGVCGLVMGAGLVFTGIKSWKKPQLGNKKNTEQEKEIASSNGKAFPFSHVSGLSIPEGMTCQVSYDEANLFITYLGGGITIERSNLLGTECKTSTEISSQYVSSIGGAAAGAMLFGPVGLIIGGRTKKKTVRDNTYYFMIAYKDSTETKYVVLDCGTYSFNAFKIKKAMGM